MSKVSIIGAGNVGATVADCLAKKDIVNDVVLLDIKENLSEGKPLICGKQHLSNIMVRV